MSNEVVQATLLTIVVSLALPAVGKVVIVAGSTYLIGRAPWSLARARAQR
jgi:hypothetical protein